MKYIDAEQLKQAILDRYVPMLNHSISQYDRGRADAQDEILDLRSKGGSAKQFEN